MEILNTGCVLNLVYRIIYFHLQNVFKKSKHGKSQSKEQNTHLTPLSSYAADDVAS